MNRRLRGQWVSCLIVMFALVGGQAGKAQEVWQRPRYVWTEQGAILMGAAELVAAPKVLGAQWSPGGNRLVVVRQSPLPVLSDPQTPSQVSVVLWNSGSRRAVEVWKRSLILPSLHL